MPPTVGPEQGRRKASARELQRAVRAAACHGYPAGRGRRCHGSPFLPIRATDLVQRILPAVEFGPGKGRFLREGLVTDGGGERPRKLHDKEIANDDDVSPRCESSDANGA